MFLGNSQRLETTLSQKLVPTASLQKSLQVLAMPIGELSEWIYQEVSMNPALEWDSESVNEAPSYKIKKDSLSELSHIPKKLTSLEKFNEHIQHTFMDLQDRILAEKILESLDSKGFLPEEIQEELEKIHAEKLSEVLYEIKRIEPFGIGCKNLQDSLLVQLEMYGLENSLPYLVVKECYSLLLASNFQAISKKLKVSPEEIAPSLKKAFRKLHLSNSLNDEDIPTRYLKPDLSIEFKSGKWNISIFSAPYESFKISENFIEKMASASKEDKLFFTTTLTSAKFLQTCLAKRVNTLKILAKVLSYKQKDFFQGKTHLPAPLTLADLSDLTGYHPSTIARALSDKAVSCCHGLIPLKQLFQSKAPQHESSSQASVLEELRNIVLKEDKKKPHSDLELLKLLQSRGFSCARRTVAKYRQVLKIPSNYKRRFFL